MNTIQSMLHKLLLMENEKKFGKPLPAQSEPLGLKVDDRTLFVRKLTIEKIDVVLFVGRRIVFNF